MSNDLIIAGRRNFLVRALGFTAASVAAVPVLKGLPTISPDVVAKMQAWRDAFGACRSAHDVYRRTNRAFVDSPGGTLTPEYAAYRELQFTENEVRNEMLRAILAKT